ncbi:hypothetical protein Tco_1563548 [Tanacetum coccineum]
MATASTASLVNPDAVRISRPRGNLSVDEPEAQLLPNFSPLDLKLGDKRGTDPPINPYSPGSFRMKVVTPLTIRTPPSPHLVMVISVISVSSDSSEDSRGHLSGTELSCSAFIDHIHHYQAISPFLSSVDDIIDSDTPDTPPTHGRSPYDICTLHLHLYLELYLSVHADLLIPSPKRVKDSGYLEDVEVDPREISLKDDVIVRVSDKPHLEQDIDPEIQAEIDECIAYADALRDRGIDARVVVEAVDRDETETGVRGPVEVRVERVTHPAMGGSSRGYAIEGVQREQGHRIVGVESAVTALTERVAELERDNRRLRGTVSVESQRVDRLQRGMSRMQRELRQMRRLRFYDRRNEMEERRKWKMEETEEMEMEETEKELEIEEKTQNGNQAY